MKYLLILGLGICLTTTSWGIIISSADHKKDPRIINIEKRNDGKVYFSLCAKRPNTACKLIVPRGFTEQELEKKVNSEKFKMHAKSVGIGAGAVVGGTIGLGFVVISSWSGVTVAGAAPIVTLGAGAGGGAVALSVDALGRSPVEHKTVLEYLTAKNTELKNRDINQAYDLYSKILSEIDRREKFDNKVEQVFTQAKQVFKRNVDNSDRGIKDVPTKRTSTAKKPSVSKQ